MTHSPAVGVEIVERSSRNRISYVLKDRFPGLDRYLEQVLTSLRFVLLNFRS